MMAVAARMTPDWSQWVGEVVSGEFPLEQFLAASAAPTCSAVFRTSAASGIRVIKLVQCSEQDSAALLERWKRAGELTHPNLMRIEKSGTWAKSGISLAFVVMEYGDENLAAVLDDRALSTEETLEMLRPVASALAFLHGQGFAHGKLKASNIFAVNDTLKISSDSIAPGETSQDLRALSGVVSHVLTQSVYPNVDRLPQPFQEIARCCAGHDGRLQWSAAELSSKLRSPETIGPPVEELIPRPRRSKLTYAIVGFMVLVVAVTIATMFRNRAAHPVDIVTTASASPTPAPAATTPASTVPAKPVKTAPPKAEKTPESAPATAAPESPTPRGAVIDAQQIVAKQVMPDISAHARGTIHGNVVLRIKVAVDESGAVTDASLLPTNSRYLGKLALTAAKNWRFVPASGAGTRDLLLRFEVTKSDTNVFVEKSAH